MRILVTGSAGHLGEALMRSLLDAGHEPRGLDLKPGERTDVVGSITDAGLVREAMDGVDAVLHTATLHKPHIVSHTRLQFVETNVAGTTVLLEEAVRRSLECFVFTSSTSAFGGALAPAADQPAAWITEEVVPQPGNVYGATKVAAEDLCELVHREHGLPVLVLRAARFFPEADDDGARRTASDDLNLKVCELLHRRADLADVVDAHIRALVRSPALGFGRYIVSATTPFTREDLADLRTDAAGVVERRCGPRPAAVFAQRGWSLVSDIDRVYVNERARADLGWEPAHSFAGAVDALDAGADPRSRLARSVGAKGYHERPTGVYTT